MNNKEFDAYLKERFDACEEPVDAGLWTGIESTLQRRGRMRIVRRSAVALLSAAACAVAVLTFRGGAGDSLRETPAGMALGSCIEGSAPAESPVSHPFLAAEETSRMMAQAQPGSGQKPSGTVAGNQEESAGAASLSSLPDGDGTPDAGAAALPVSAGPEPRRETPYVADAGAAVVAASSQEEAPFDWDALLLEEEKRLERSDRKPVLALVSNLTTNNSDGLSHPSGIIYHAGSKDGTRAASGLPVAVSEPTYFMPLSFGAQLKFPVAGRLSVGTGINYTYIVSKYEAMVRGVLYENTYSQLHYLGVPLNLYLDLLRSDRCGAYLTAGAMVDKCLRSRYIFGSEVVGEEVSGVQFSAMAGVGIEYWCTRHMGLYLDPSLVYYFNNTGHSQPLSIRTAEPLQIRFEAGLRFRF